MLSKLVRAALLVALSLPAFLSPALAEPITLNLAYFSSDREPPFVSVMKPFADAVNEEAKGILQIKLHPGGVLGRNYQLQAQLVLDGTADMAWVNPSLTPDLFSDSAVMQLPGLFRDLTEATLAHTALMNAVPLRGYDKFVMLGAFVNYPLMFHMRDPVGSLADLRGKKVRANSIIEVATLDALGIQSTVLPVNEIAIAISQKTLDGTTMPPGSLVAYGISRITRYHYAASLGGAPLNFLMNRAKFESLPRAGQDAIRKYSGRWTAARFIEAYNANNESAMARFKADGARSVVEPSPSDLDALQGAFNKVINGWTATDPRNAELLEILKMELATLRAATTGEGPR